MGFTTNELAAALAEQEVIIKAPTLNRCLSEFQAGRKKVAAAESEAAEVPANNAGPHNETRNVPAGIPGVSESKSADRPKTFAAVSAE